LGYQQLADPVTLVGQVAVLMPVASQAQEDSATVLDEIKVTATRRVEGADIQTTPISVTALDSDDIDALVPHDLTDIALMVPNLGLRLVRDCK
jgi:outer membrane cobalamin receptor